MKARPRDCQALTERVACTEHSIFLVSQTDADEPVQIHTQARSVRGANRTYVRDVQIGRKETCDVQVESGVVSRIHAKIVFEGGRWWVVDEESTNGTFLDGEQIDRVLLPAEAEMQLGEDGPTFQLERPDAEGDSASGSDQTQGESRTPGSASSEGAASRQSDSFEEATAEPGSVRPEGSVTQYVQHYFEDDDRPAGEHTRMLRQAYQRVQQKERRQYLWAVAGVLVLCLVLAGYAVVQHLRNERLEARAQEVFAGMKEQDLRVAQLKRRIEESGGASLEKQLAALEEKQREQRERYDGWVKELGVYRELTPKEREIYQMARIFGESEFSIPAGFVRRVKETIENYWQTSRGRSRLVSAIRRAEQKGYTPFIVKTMREHALPPEFFYLALQESGFRVNAVGPRTRWGIAKGMWQFIPSTAQKYGLRVGPRKGQPRVDLQDERHDFQKSTRAAARYLQTIYSTEAQASGLLVIASYNWGEHRVVDGLEHLPGPQGIPDEALEGIPEDPDERNYWRFLKEYDARIPEQTKDYVLKVFSAAVIGRNPGLFEFDFENPLKEHLTVSPVSKADSPEGSTDSGAKDHRPTPRSKGGER